MPAVISILLLLFIGALFLYRRKRFARKRFFYPPTAHDDQLTAVSSGRVNFKTKPILWPREYRAFRAAQKVLTKYGRTDCRLWAQVCLGELFTVESHDSVDAKQALASINSKRSDIVLTDSKGYALALIEYQGRQHYQGSAYKRDAIKRFVAQRAGVLFLELNHDWTEEQIEEALGKGLEHLLVATPKPAKYEQLPTPNGDH